MNRLLLILLTIFSINNLRAMDLLQPVPRQVIDFSAWSSASQCGAATPPPVWGVTPLTLEEEEDDSLVIVGEGDCDTLNFPPAEMVHTVLTSRFNSPQPVVWLSGISLESGKISFFKAVDGSALFKLALHDGDACWFQVVGFFGTEIVVAECDDAVAKGATRVECELTQYNRYKQFDGRQEVISYGLSAKP